MTPLIGWGFAANAAIHACPPNWVRVNDSSGLHSQSRHDSYPDHEALKCLGAYWFGRADRWARRHAELVQIESDRDAQRLLTVDFELPTDPDASLPWNGADRFYLVPAALVSKEPRSSHVKVFDERGDEVQLFTKDENSEISATALQVMAASALAGAGASGERAQLIEYLLRQLTVESGVAAQLYAAMAELEIKAAKDDLEEGIQRRLYALIEDLMASTLLWVPLIGVPRQQRSLRFADQTTFKASPVLGKLWQRVSVARTKVELEGGRSYPLEQKLVDANTRGTSRRAWNRVARTTGFSSYELKLRRPAVQRAFSYHLQVESPSGVEVRRMQLLGRIKWLPGGHGHVNVDTTTTRGHLYFSKAEWVPPEPALIELRVVRRGLLFFPALVGILIAMMLWFFATHPRSAMAPNAQAVTGATLLITPALLLVFAFRQEEHPLLTHLLSGVRLLVLLAGVCSVAAAMAVVGIWPFGHIHATWPHSGMPWESVGRNWHYEAIVASVIAVLLCMAWLLALHAVDLVRRAVEGYCRNDARYAVTAVVLILAQAGIARVMVIRGNGHGGWFAVLALAIAAASALSGWLAAYGEVNGCSLGAPCLVAAGLISLTVFLSFLGLDVGLKSWDDVGKASVLVLPVALFFASAEAFAVVNAGTGRKLASGQELEPGSQESESERQPGYDLSAPSAQGEAQLTPKVRELAKTMLADYRQPPAKSVSEPKRMTLVRLLLQPWEVKGDEVTLKMPPTPQALELRHAASAKLPPATRS